MTTLSGNDTICAIATAPGVGGIAVIRLSGKRAFEIATACLHRAEGSVSLGKETARRAIYAEWREGEELIDDVIALSFVAPHSYTGEDVVEISCHGSHYITRRILEGMTSRGARIARAGEFTQRAYLSGRMDLSSAEAVADLIAAESKAQHEMATKQMRGSYSREFDSLRERLLMFASLMELELDFAEEDVEFADRKELLSLSSELEAKIRRLSESFRLGNAIRKGIPVAIVGVTNAGKSTLLNQLVGEERAIVSDIHGTTRDSIEELINIAGLVFRFVDTAGLRETTDEIESIGIQRSLRKIQEASLLLLVADGTRLEDGSSQIHELKASLSGDLTAPLLILLNKTDQLPVEQVLKAEDLLSKHFPTAYAIIPTSTREGEGLDILRIKLVEASGLSKLSSSDLIVSNARHHALLEEALACLDRLHKGLESGIPTDLLAPDLRAAISHIGEITGAVISREETLHNIFRHFCIGK